MANQKYTFEELLRILEQTDRTIIFPPDTVKALFTKYAQTKDQDEVQGVLLESVCSIIFRYGIKPL